MTYLTTISSLDKVCGLIFLESPIPHSYVEYASYCIPTMTSKLLDHPMSLSEFKQWASALPDELQDDKHHTSLEALSAFYTKKADPPANGEHYT